MPSHMRADQSRFVFHTASQSFLVTAFTAEEAISQLFRVNLKLASEDAIDLNDVLGRTGMLAIEAQEEDRYFHGIILEFRRTGVCGRFHLYEAILSPQAALLEHRCDCRIFQRATAPEIVARVLSAAGITADLFTFRLQSQYPRREYCVQYRESDLHFILRILAEEGIFFFFEHSRNRHLMVFGDSPVNYQPFSRISRVRFNPDTSLVADRPVVIAFSRGQRVCSDLYRHQDFNFEKPALDLTTCDPADAAGHLEHYDSPGCYALPEQGRRLARVRLQQLRTTWDLGRGKSIAAMFAAGFIIDLVDTVPDDLDGSYLLVALRHHGTQPQVLAERTPAGAGSSYVNSFTAVPASVPVRPAPRAKPFVKGVQTAMVTGPAGEEIHTDRHGRVKVRFHWDRQRAGDGGSSCWIRVSQWWAGSGWGAMFIPRIGQEVIVDFLEGDPDRPLIIGRVFHAENPPPYPLPGQKTVSTLKSLSTPGGEGFNEIRLEDRKGSEEIFIHAERDMVLRVKRERRSRIGRNLHSIVNKDCNQRIDGSHHATVGKHLCEQIEGTLSQQVGRDLNEKVSGHAGLASDGQIHLSAGTRLVLEARRALTLKAGSGFLTIDNGGISICGPRIGLNSGGAPGAGRGTFLTGSEAPLARVSPHPGSPDHAPPTVSAGSAEAAISAGTAGPAIAFTQVPPSENLLVRLHRKGPASDLRLALQNGYQLHGPRHLTGPSGRPKRYSTLCHRKTPAGSYTLAFNPFNIEPEAIKKPKEH